MTSSEFIDPAKLDLDDQVVAINRITKVVKGGRRMRFAALVIVGDVRAMLVLVLVRLKKFLKLFVRLKLLLKRT